MRVPRVRFTVRRMMVAVAIFALVLVVAIPIFKSLIWLYNAPNSITDFHSSLDPWSDRIRKPVSVGQSVALHFPYLCEMGSSLPRWVPYRVNVEVKVIYALPGQDYSTGTVEEAREKTHILIKGVDSWRTARGKLNFELTPRRPGNYIIRYETHATDVFGRNGMAECNTAGFKVL